MDKARAVLAAARRYIANGWKLIPLEGKLPHKDPRIHKRIGVKQATDDLRVVKEWVRRWPDMNLGGTPPQGVTIIDIDVYKDPDLLEPLAKELRRLGAPYQQTQSGGAHFLVSGTVPSQGDLCKHHGVKGIDVREHDKGYVVLAPSTGYAWKHDPHEHDAPPLPSTWINGFAYDTPTAKPATAAKSIPDLWNAREAKKVRRALKVLDPDVEYPDWIRIGQALHSADPALSGPAYEAWLRWSEQGSKFKSEKDLRFHWNSFGQQGGVTLATLYGMAKDATPRKPVEDTEGDASSDYVDQDEDALTITSLEDIELKAVDWLLPDVLARGQLTVLAGDGGSGKSTFAARVVHQLVHGGYWPSAGYQHQGKAVPAAGDVLVLAAEEDMGSGIKPRYMAQGTNLRHVGLITDNKAKTQKHISLTEDLRKLERALRKRTRKVVALIIDPITGYLGDVKQNDEGELREALQELVNFARRNDVAVLALAHMNKKLDLGSVARVMGGVAFVNVARHVMVMAPDPDDEMHRYCVVAKSNIGDVGLGFVLRGMRAPNPADAEREVRWCEVDDEVQHGMDADALVRAARRATDQSAERAEGMGAWLISAIGNAQEHGVDFATLEAHARTQWTEANPDQELPGSFTQMVKNALGRLVRRHRVVRLLSTRARMARGGHPQAQRYYLPEHADTEFSNALD